jgi:hypothetical protein
VANVYPELVTRLYSGAPLLHVALSVLSNLLGQAAHNRRELISGAQRPCRLGYCYQAATNLS